MALFKAFLKAALVLFDPKAAAVMKSLSASFKRTGPTCLKWYHHAY